MEEESIAAVMIGLVLGALALCIVCLYHSLPPFEYTPDDGRQAVSATSQSSTTLEDVPSDIWVNCMIHLLSVQDIVRLSGVSKRLAATFDSERIFKKLCMDRFNISPNMPAEASYYQIFKLMSASQFLAAIDLEMAVAVERMFWKEEKAYISDYRVASKELDMLVHYVLTLNAKATSRQEDRYEGFLRSPKVTDKVSIHMAQVLFPVLDEKTIKTEYEGPVGIDDNSSMTYEIGSLIDLSIKKHGSLEAHQWMHIQLQHRQLPEILPLLWLSLRGRRLSSITSTLQRDHANGTLIGSLKVTRPSEGLERLGRVHDPELTAEWYKTAEDVCGFHSALHLYVKSDLLFSLQDYFDACRHFEAHCLPRSICSPQSEPFPGRNLALIYNNLVLDMLLQDWYAVYPSGKVMDATSLLLAMISSMKDIYRHLRHP